MVLEPFGKTTCEKSEQERGHPSDSAFAVGEVYLTMGCNAKSGRGPKGGHALPDWDSWHSGDKGRQSQPLRVAP